MFVYFFLFFSFFLKITDEKKRDLPRHLALILIMFYTLFMSSYLFRHIYITPEILVSRHYLYESITNTFFLILVFTNVRKDIFFKSYNNLKLNTRAVIGDSVNVFFSTKEELKDLKNHMLVLLEVKNRSKEDIALYLSAFSYFEAHPNSYTEGIVLKDLDDLPNLDLDTMVREYNYIQGANLSFSSKWKEDVRYIENMKKQGKGVRLFRLFLLTLIGILYVPYCNLKRIKRI